MKKKLVLAFLAGVVLTSLLFITFNVLTSSVKADNDSAAATPPDDATILQQFQASLAKVSTEINDPDTKNYYDKLTSSYDLNNVNNDASTASAATTALPDITKIQQTALSLPLTEAGKTITDKDIAQFYQKFLSDVGINEAAQ